MPRCSRALLTIVALAVTTACGRRDAGKAGSYFSNTSPDTAPLVLGAGDVKISNPDSSMDLALVGDSVFMQFGEKVQRQLQRDLDTAHVDTSSRLGAFIEKSVKRSVGSMLDRRIAFGLADLRSVSYRDGRIVFDYRNKPGFSFENMEVDNNRPVLESFSAEDAQRFVAAVQARMARREARD